MSAANTKQESRRRVAERVSWSTIGNCVEPLLRGQLIDAIEAALKNRDERAARILEAGSDGVGGDWECHEAAAAIINEES